MSKRKVKKMDAVCSHREGVTNITVDFDHRLVTITDAWGVAREVTVDPMFSKFVVPVRSLK